MSSSKCVIDSLIAARLPGQARLRELCQPTHLRIAAEERGGKLSANHLAVASENAAAAQSAVHDRGFLDQLNQFTRAYLLAEELRE